MTCHRSPAPPATNLVHGEYTTVYYASNIPALGVDMRWHMGALSSIVLVLCLAAGSPAVTTADVTVFAVASLKEAMNDQAKTFEAGTDNKVIVSYGASNVLARKIEAGAPADIFIAADLDSMDYVATRNLLAPNTRVNLLRNALVLIAPSSSNPRLKIESNFALAAALGTEKLAMAIPESVPAGKYGKSALEKLGVGAGVEKQVAHAENVRAALALVFRGEAPFGIVGHG